MAFTAYEPRTKEHNVYRAKSCQFPCWYAHQPRPAYRRDVSSYSEILKKWREAKWRNPPRPAITSGDKCHESRGHGMTQVSEDACLGLDGWRDVQTIFWTIPFHDQCLYECCVWEDFLWGEEQNYYACKIIGPIGAYGFVVWTGLWFGDCK